MKKLALFLNSLFLAGCSMVGIRNTEQAAYEVIFRQDEVEIRNYKELIIAETEIDGDYNNSGSIGFNRLAGYIFGRNIQKQQIPMTSPVYREAVSEKIAMTAPVIQQKTNQKWSMAFVMPAEYSLETLPEPLDPMVVIKQIPSKKVAVLVYSGSLNAERITDKSQQLLSWLKANQYTPLSIARSAAYDPPWTIPALRRNEIHIDID
jgi:effector-binding domain-containing protein